MQHLSSKKFHLFTRHWHIAFWQLSGVTLPLTFHYWAHCPRRFWWTCPCWHLSPWQRAHNSACGPATPSVCTITKTWRTTLKHLKTESNSLSECLLTDIFCPETLRFYEGKEPSWPTYNHCFFYLFHTDLLTFAAQIHSVHTWCPLTTTLNYSLFLSFTECVVNVCCNLNTLPQVTLPCLPGVRLVDVNDIA